MYFEIYGYDSNWDMGGSHHNPKLCTVKANSRAQAEEYAKILKALGIAGMAEDILRKSKL